MLDGIYKQTSAQMHKSLQALLKDFTTLRSGKVSINLVENVRVDYYGTPTPLNQVGSVIASDASTLSITPWEKNLLKDIERALQEANLGVNPNNDGESVKLFFPPMTSEQRKEIAKDAKGMGEKAKVAVRNIRQDANNQIKKLEKDKEISEDQSKKALAEVQKITDTAIKKIEDALKAKEEEILKL
ncbi:ribosome recycling factor [Helicobacter baculiformis]|uniref:Ribosome-recycling factor n=1 Tax=Helicobacter baculiformis TaxID=427351 RepID=A0ABV7ZLQ8_9HELI|nr:MULTISPECIES: ribosome recycling factor [Helicobacter]